MNENSNSDVAKTALFAVEWYATRLTESGANDAELKEARDEVVEFLQGADVPKDVRDATLSVLSAVLQCLTSARRLEEKELERARAQVAEKRRRAFLACWKAFVVLLLVVTTAVLWQTSATALGAVVPIILIVYVLLGDALPLKLATSFYKKENAE